MMIQKHDVLFRRQNLLALVDYVIDQHVLTDITSLVIEFSENSFSGGTTVTVNDKLITKVSKIFAEEEYGNLINELTKGGFSPTYTKHNERKLKLCLI